MKLIERIKADQLTARKTNDKVASGALSALLSEASMVGKNAGNRASNDEEVVATIKKFIKNAELTSAALDDKFEKRMGFPKNDSKTRILEEANRLFMEEIVPQMRAIEREISILNDYLPSQLEEATIRGIIAESAFSTMGDVMKYFKEHYTGRYDGKLVSSIAKETFS